MIFLVCVLSGLTALARCVSINHAVSLDFLPANNGESPYCEEEVEFKYKWVGVGGSIHDEDEGDMLEVAATLAVTDHIHNVGTDIVASMLRNAPDEVFFELIQRGSVGFFTAEEKTTIFPEYCHLKDRPECEGTCLDECSDTCIDDDRKYDDLPGMGRERATTVDDNIECNVNDPYDSTYLVIGHEFAHTVMAYGLVYVNQTTDWWNHIIDAYEAAIENETWDLDSKAMMNHEEYFAEGTSVFFNVNNHETFSGGMNSCGRETGFCETEQEARDWLRQQDPDLYTALSFTFTNYQDSLPGELQICMA